MQSTGQRRNKPPSKRSGASVSVEEKTKTVMGIVKLEQKELYPRCCGHHNVGQEPSDGVLLQCISHEGERKEAHNGQQEGSKWNELLELGALIGSQQENPHP